MPKEKIYDSARLFDIEVGWTRDCGPVQVGIVTHSGVSIASWLGGVSSEVTDAEDVLKSELPTGATTGIGPHRYRTAKNETPSDLPSFNSLWGTLDRAQINRMIKMLRKARDEAYGTDE